LVDNLKDRVKTIHSVQGAEAPVVLFSLVTQNAYTPFIDRAFINVTVSRARQAFAIFADPKALFAEPDEQRVSSPVMELGAYLRNFGTRLYPSELIVVESPAKRPAFKEALGRQVVVVASGGHFRDLDLADVDDDLSHPPWRITNAEAIDGIERIYRDLGASLQRFTIATDDDLEGESIGWHVLDALAQRGLVVPSHLVYRLRTSSITTEAIQAAHAGSGRGLDVGRVRAALTRRFVDLVVGARAGMGQRGYGRVKQTLLLAVAHLAERFAIAYRMEDADRSERHNVYVVDGSSSASAPLLLRRREDAERLREALPVEVELTQTDGIYREVPPPPRDTLGVYAAAAELLHFTPEQTRAMLQELYLGQRDVAVAEELA
jgi:DNA topoisomerase-1